MDAVRLLAISGSERSGSWNRKLLAVAEAAAGARGALVTPLDLRALGLPVYDGDLEKAQASVETVITALLRVAMALKTAG
jgi:chromate reductase, NAD(P)H dehydrogenase (quinone)